MILALIAVGAAVVLAMTLSSTESQSALTSETLVRAAKARAASAGGIDIACALVDRHGLVGFGEVDRDLEGKSTLLFAPVTIGAATYSGTVCDLEDNTPLHRDTIAVRLRVEATADELTQLSTAVGRLVQPDTVYRTDLDLSEFGLLATGGSGSIRFENGATLGVWKSSPLSVLREPILVGSSTLDADAAVIPATAARGHAVLQQGPFPTNDNDFMDLLAAKVFQIPLDEVPVPHAPRPGRSPYIRHAALTDDPEQQLVQLRQQLDGSQIGTGFEMLSATELGSVHFTNSEVCACQPTAGESVTVGPVIDSAGKPYPREGSAEWRQLDFAGDLSISLVTFDVQVPTLLIVRGDLSLHQANLIVGEGASLTIVVFGSVDVAGSVIGERSIPDLPVGGGGGSKDPEGGTDNTSPPAPYVIGEFHSHYPPHGASKIVIYGTRDAGTVVDGTPSNRFRLEETEIAAQIYAPTRHIEFKDASLFGSAVCADITFVGADAAFLYDPALNGGRGWSNPVSAVWEDGLPRPELLEIAELTDRDLAAAIAAASSDPEAASISPDALGNGIIVPLHAGFAGGHSAGFLERIANVTLRLGTTEANTTILGAMVHDIRQHGDLHGNTDFGRETSAHRGTWVRLVEPTLDAGDRPVFNGNPAAPAVAKSLRYRTSSLHEICWTLFDETKADSTEPFTNPEESGSPIASATTFAGWFRDDGAGNLARPVAVNLVEVVPGTYEFEFTDGADVGIVNASDPAGWRLFGELPLLGDPSDSKETYALEMLLEFDYDSAAAQAFSVTSSGDLWVFVNGALVAEIGSGGAGHVDTTQIVPIDRLGIPHDTQCEIRIFYAHRERHAAPYTKLRFASNFAVGTPRPFIESAPFTQPDEAADRIDAARDHIGELRDDGLPPVHFGDRSLANWSRRFE